MYQYKYFLQLFLITGILAGLTSCNRKVSRKAHKTGGLADACSILGTSGNEATNPSTDSPFGDDSSFFLNPIGIDSKTVGKVEGEAIEIKSTNYEGMFSIPRISIVPTANMLNSNVETVFVQVTDLEGSISYPPNDELYQGYYRPFSGALRLGCMKGLIGKKVKVNFFPCVHKDNLDTSEASKHGHGYVCFDGEDQTHTRYLYYDFFSPNYQKLIDPDDQEKIMEGFCELERAQYEGNITVAEDLKKIADDYFAGTLSGGNDSISSALKVYKDIHGIGRMVAELEINTPQNLEFMKDIEATERQSASLALTNTDQLLSAADCVDENGSVDGDPDGSDSSYTPPSDNSIFGDGFFEQEPVDTGTGGDNEEIDQGDTSSSSTTEEEGDETEGTDTSSNDDSDASDDSADSSEGPNPVEAQIDDPEGSKKTGMFVSIAVSVIAFTTAGAAITNRLGLWGEKRVQRKNSKILTDYDEALKGLNNASPDQLKVKVDAYNDTVRARKKQILTDNTLDEKIKADKITRLDKQIINDTDLKPVFGDDYKANPRFNEAEFKNRGIDLDPNYKGKPLSGPDAPKTGGRWKGNASIFFYFVLGGGAAFNASTYNLALTKAKSVEEALIDAGTNKIELEEKLQDLETKNSEYYLQIRKTIEESR